MVKLDQTSVIAEFRQLSGCSQQQANDSLFIINNACHLISRLLDEIKCTSADITAAQYAAATVAFYDFICSENARSKIICTLTGKASTDIDHKSRIESAKDLRDSALKAIKPCMLGCDHLFMAIG